MPFWVILRTAAAAIVTVLLACGSGAWLARRGVLHESARACLSGLVFRLLLPCLLVVKLSQSLSLASLATWWMLPVSALIYVGLGLAFGVACRALVGPTPEFRQGMVAATGFGNSGYLPMSLVAVIGAMAPWLQDDPGAADRGIAYISVYLLGLSTCLWGIGYPYLSGMKMRRALADKLLSPPIVAMLVGAGVGVCPPLKGLFHGAGAPLAMVTAAADLLGAAAIPCAMLVLGANLARGPGRGGVGAPVVAAVSLVRLVVMPGVGVGLVLLLKWAGLLPRDPVFRLVLLLEAATPSAMNLVIMCQLHGRGEQAMAATLFWEYVFSILSLTVWVSIFLYLVFAGALAG